MNQPNTPIPPKPTLEDLKRVFYQEVLPKFLPFADAATTELPLSRLLRLSLFQIAVGMAVVLLTGTLNRVMVVEMGVPAWLVGLMVSLPLIFAPLRALIGFRSDVHRSAFGWRRVPYIWFGTLMQFGGFAFMPFALLVLSDKGTEAPVLIGHFAAAAAFLLVGAGLHTVQTAGLALATDLAPPDKRPRVVALLYVSLLVGMLASALIFGWLLTDYSPGRLIQVIQGAAVVTLALNLVALWKQEAVNRERAAENKLHADEPLPKFTEAWRDFVAGGKASKLLIAVGLGTAAFTMQDILLEPYGAKVLGLTVAETTRLTALWAFGMLIAYGLSAHFLGRGGEPHRFALYGALAGVIAFVAVIGGGVIDSPTVFRGGAVLIGFGAGLFGVGTLIAAMNLAEGSHSGLALGAWGAVQATAQGVAIFFGTALRDVVALLAGNGVFGPTAGANLAFSYNVVYSLEILLLLVTLVAIGPLALRAAADAGRSSSKFGLSELP